MTRALIFCLPWQSTCRRVPNSTLPKGVYALDQEPRSANSGTVMGSVAAMRTLFKDLFEVLQEPERQEQGDQGNNPARPLVLPLDDQRYLQVLSTNFSRTEKDTYPSITIPDSSGQQAFPHRPPLANLSTRRTTSTLSFRTSYTHLYYTMQ
jgi:hypothetical protein